MLSAAAPAHRAQDARFGHDFAAVRVRAVNAAIACKHPEDEEGRVPIPSVGQALEAANLLIPSPVGPVLRAGEAAGDAAIRFGRRAGQVAETAGSFVSDTARGVGGAMGRGVDAVFGEGTPANDAAEVVGQHVRGLREGIGSGVRRPIDRVRNVVGPAEERTVDWLTGQARRAVTGMREWLP